MAVTFRDRYQCVVTAAPGTAGDFAIGSAVPGFQTFSYLDNGLTFDIIINDGVNYTDWEIRKDCAYSNGVLTRGTLVSSSTGSALSLTNACVLAVTLLAQRAVPVTVTTPSTNQVLQFNGTDWVNATLSGGGSYVLPIATDTVLGGIKIGSGLTINSGTGVVASTPSWSAITSTPTSLSGYGINDAQPLNANLTSFSTLSTTSTGIVKLTNGVASLDTSSYLTSIPTASDTVLGGIKVGTGLAIDGSGILSATGGGSYVLPTATTTVLGGVKVDGSTITVAGDGTISTSGTSSTSIIRQYVKNNTGIALTKGQAVYITGADGTNVLIGLARANTEQTSSKTLGLLEQNLAVNASGWVVTEGALAGLNTNGSNAGDAVWLSPTTPGGLVYGLANKPVAPNHMVYLGVVSRAQTNNGEIFIQVQNGFELQELHNVLINGVTNNDVLKYDSTSGLWKNAPESSSYTLPTASTTVLGGVKIDGTSITINNGIISSSGGSVLMVDGGDASSTYQSNLDGGGA